MQAMDGNCKGQYDAAEIPLVLDADRPTVLTLVLAPNVTLAP